MDKIKIDNRGQHSNPELMRGNNVNNLAILENNVNIIKEKTIQKYFPKNNNLIRSFEQLYKINREHYKIIKM